MIDRDKVLKALDCISHGGGINECYMFPCPYGFYGYTDCKKWIIAREAMALIKEQEKVKTYGGIIDITHTDLYPIVYEKIIEALIDNNVLLIDTERLPGITRVQWKLKGVPYERPSEEH